MSAHVHEVSRSEQGSPMPRYDFCSCGQIRCVWPSGRTLDWHEKSREGGSAAQRIDAEERAAGAELQASTRRLADRMDADSFSSFCAALRAMPHLVAVKHRPSAVAVKRAPKKVEQHYDYEPRNYCHCSEPGVCPPCSWCENGGGSDE